MKTHEQNVRDNPELVRKNLAAMIQERNGYLDKLKRARSSSNQAMWRGRAGWAQKMIERYEDDLRLCDAPQPTPDTRTNGGATMTNEQQLRLTNLHREMTGAQREYDSSRSKVRENFWRAEILRLAEEISRIESQPTLDPAPDDATISGQSEMGLESSADILHASYNHEITPTASPPAPDPAPEDAAARMAPRTAWRYGRRWNMFGAALLALALATPAHAMPASEVPAFVTDIPTGCAVTAYFPDDYSARGVCAGGYVITKQDGPHGAWDDIPYAIGSVRIGPDASGAYHDWPTMD